MNEQSLSDALMYASYYAQRHDYGMSAASASRLFNDAERFERRYQDTLNGVQPCVMIPTDSSTK